MINQKEIFAGIVRVIGLKEALFALMSISAFLMPQWTQMKNFWNGMPIQMISPLILLVIGIYLLVGGRYIINQGYPESGETEPWSARTVFVLGMKTLGIYLMIQQVEGLLLNINTWLTTYGMLHNEITGPSPLSEYDIFWVIPFLLLWFVLGFYLLKRGDLIIRLAFGEKGQR